MIQPVYEKINFSRNVGKIKEQVRVEVRTDVRSSDVENILSIGSWVCANECKAKEKEIDYSGKTVFCFSYVDVENGVKKIECSREFSGTVKELLATDLCKCKTTVVIEKTDADLSGTFVVLTAVLTVDVYLTVDESVNALVGGDELMVNPKEIEIKKILCANKGVYPLEEEFELDYCVKEVLFHRADAVISNVQSGVGSIIIDGQVLFSLVLLQNNDKNDIIRENRTFPFRMELECEDAMPNVIATARVNERSHKIDVSVDTNSAKSVVSVNVHLVFNGEVESCQTLSVGVDAFSLTSEVELEKLSLPIFALREVRTHDCFIKGRAETSELPVSTSVLAVCDERAQIISSNCENGSIKVIGTVGVTALLKADGKVFSQKLEFPFEQAFDGDYDCELCHTATAKVQNASAKIISLTQMQVECQLFLTVYPCQKNVVNTICGINVLKEKPKNDSALTVYIPVEGEDLWSLAKRLNQDPKTLIETNSDLQFPLSGDERIVVYRGGKVKA